MTHPTEELLIDYLHGELPDADDARLHAHLAECSECRVLADEHATIGDLVRADAAAHELEFPSTIKAHVWATIRDDRPSLLDQLRSFVRPMVAVPVAVAFALLLVFAGPMLHLRDAASGSTGVSASYYLEEHAAEGQANPLADRLPTAIQTTGATAAHTAPPLIDAADAATLDDPLVTND